VQVLFAVGVRMGGVGVGVGIGVSMVLVLSSKYARLIAASAVLRDTSALGLVNALGVLLATDALCCCRHGPLIGRTNVGVTAVRVTHQDHGQVQHRQQNATQDVARSACVSMCRMHS